MVHALVLLENVRFTDFKMFDPAKIHLQKKTKR